MPQTDWQNMKRSSDRRREIRAGERVTTSGVSFKDLMEHTRKQLNEIARDRGIADPESMENKRAVAEAITNA